MAAVGRDISKSYINLSNDIEIDSKNYMNIEQKDPKWVSDATKLIKNNLENDFRKFERERKDYISKFKQREIQNKIKDIKKEIGYPNPQDYPHNILGFFSNFLQSLNEDCGICCYQRCVKPGKIIKEYQLIDVRGNLLPFYGRECYCDDHKDECTNSLKLPLDYYGNYKNKHNNIDKYFIVDQFPVQDALYIKEIIENKSKPFIDQLNLLYSIRKKYTNFMDGETDETKNLLAEINGRILYNSKCHSNKKLHCKIDWKHKHRLLKEETIIDMIKIILSYIDKNALKIINNYTRHIKDIKDSEEKSDGIKKPISISKLKGISFGKKFIPKASRKSKKASRKSKKAFRKSKKASRKSRKTSKRSRKTK